MGREPKKSRKAPKGAVSVVELRQQLHTMQAQVDIVGAAVEKLQSLQVPAVPVRGPNRATRGLGTIAGYLSDLTAATTRVELDLGGHATS